jgi:hypothetical protein
VEAVIKKVLAKKPEQRYDSGTEFANAFIATLAKPLTAEANLFKPIIPPVHKRSPEAPSVPAPVSKDQPVSRYWWTWISNVVRKMSR